MIVRSSFCRASGNGGQRPERGFTLIELIVVIAIVSALITITLPAVHTAREVARRTTCRNHIKQLALGALLHHDQQGHFPTGGWTKSWAGDPDRGFGLRQPGGWAYNVLPFIEQAALHDLGAGQSLDQKVLAIRQRDATPVPIFFCPSRRAPLVLRGTDKRPAMETSRYHNAPDSAWDRYGDALEYAPLDYQANDGDRTAHSCSQPILSGTPRTWAQADDPDWEWPSDVSSGGVMFYRSRIGLHQITDGSSKTYLIGERHVFSQFYTTSWANIPWNEEDAWLRNPYAASPFSGQGLVGQSRLLRDSPYVRRMGRYWDTDFGSAHREGANFAMCDGSVRAVSYDIEDVLHQRLEHRNDGKSASLP